MNIIKHLAETNDYEFNIDKALEEMTELMEVLLKSKLKDKADKSPKNKDITDEIGDVQIRLNILKEMFGKENCEERERAKTLKYFSYIENNEYTGRI